MRKRVLECLHRQVIATERTLANELRNDALYHRNTWVPRGLIRPLAWLRNHPLVVRYHLHALKRDGLVDMSGTRLTLTAKGLEATDLPLIAVKITYRKRQDPAPVHIRQVHPL